MPITVSDLAIAPVKGLRLMPCDELRLTERGPQGDRAYLVVDDSRELLPTPRTPDLLQVAPSFVAGTGELRLAFPDGQEVRAVPEPGEAASTSFYDGRRATGRLVGGPLAQALSEHLSRGVALLALDPGQRGADDFAVTLMSAASLAALGEALEDGTPDPRRFRMTVTVDGAEPWEEHGWAGCELSAGEAGLRVTDPVPRCVVTTRDPEQGRVDAPVLSALAQLRGQDDVTFGVWCEVTRPGRVRVGDPVQPASGS